MPKKPVSKALSKLPGTKLSKEQAQLEKAKKEVLARGSKHKKPIMLAKHRVVKMTLSILGAVVVTFLIVIGFLIYVSKSDSVVVYRTAQIVPFPAARVNGSFISYADYLFEVRYRKNIYANPTGPASASQQPVDFKSEEGQTLLKSIQTESIKRAKAKAVIKQLASSKNVVVSKEELESGINGLIERQGGRDKFIQAIDDFYGWNLNDFEEEFHLQVLQQKLELAVLPEYSAKQRSQAEGLLKQARDGKDFAKLAKKYSQDPGSKAAGGDLGFIDQETPYVEEFKTAALALKKNQISDVVVTQFGFHILKATDVKDGKVKVSHILIEFGKSMDAVIQDELDKAQVTNFVNFTAPAESKPGADQG